MIDIAKRTGMGALLLMVLPSLFWISNWQWRPEIDYYRLKGWYWLTQTVSSPWGILTTSTLLISWFLWCLRYHFKQSLRLATILTAILFLGQGIKLFIKEQIQESRPYVVWLEKNYTIDDKAFYAMPHKARSVSVAKKLTGQQSIIPPIPPWLQKHWQSETGFSFPSGHTIFATSWALLALGLIWPRRCVVSTIAMIVWANCIIVSRILLGMHWPQDIVMGVVVSWLVIFIGCWLVRRWIGVLA